MIVNTKSDPEIRCHSLPISFSIFVATSKSSFLVTLKFDFEQGTV
jgi:hypothetical protein